MADADRMNVPESDSPVLSNDDEDSRPLEAEQAEHAERFLEELLAERLPEQEIPRAAARPLIPPAPVGAPPPPPPPERAETERPPTGATTANPIPGAIGGAAGYLPQDGARVLEDSIIQRILQNLSEGARETIVQRNMLEMLCMGIISPERISRCWGEGAARCFKVSSECQEKKDKIELTPIEDCYSCPISTCGFEDPVITVDGSVYERTFIEQWFRQRRTEGLPITSPVTGLQLSCPILMPLPILRGVIESFLDHRPEFRELRDAKHMLYEERVRAQDVLVQFAEQANQLQAEKAKVAQLQAELAQFRTNQGQFGGLPQQPPEPPPGLPDHLVLPEVPGSDSLETLQKSTSPEPEWHLPTDLLDIQQDEGFVPLPEAVPSTISVEPQETGITDFPSLSDAVPREDETSKGTKKRNKIRHESATSATETSGLTITPPPPPPPGLPTLSPVGEDAVTGSNADCAASNTECTGAAPSSGCAPTSKVPATPPQGASPTRSRRYSSADCPTGSRLPVRKHTVKLTFNRGDRGKLGFTINPPDRIGETDDDNRCTEWVVDTVRPDGLVGRSGAVRPGDRVLAVNGEIVDLLSDEDIGAVLKRRPLELLVWRTLSASDPDPDPQDWPQSEANEWPASDSPFQQVANIPNPVVAELLSAGRADVGSGGMFCGVAPAASSTNMASAKRKACPGVFADTEKGQLVAASFTAADVVGLHLDLSMAVVHPGCADGLVVAGDVLVQADGENVERGHVEGIWKRMHEKPVSLVFWRNR